MPLIAYDMGELDKSNGYHCIYCLLESTKVFNFVKGCEDRIETLNIYGTLHSRDNALKYWQAKRKLTDTVFFTFQIPIDFYIEKAEKHI